MVNGNQPQRAAQVKRVRKGRFRAVWGRFPEKFSRKVRKGRQVACDHPKLLRDLGVLGERRFSDRKRAATGRAGEKGSEKAVFGPFGTVFR